MILLTTEKSFTLHASYFLGKPRAFKIQIIGELLPVKGNIEGSGLFLHRYCIQVGQQAAAAAFGRGVKDPPGERQIFMCRDKQKVFRQLFFPAIFPVSCGQTCFF